jgi:hypothetical protein
MKEIINTSLLDDGYLTKQHLKLFSSNDEHSNTWIRVDTCGFKQETLHAHECMKRTYVPCGRVAVTPFDIDTLCVVTVTHIVPHSWKVISTCTSTSRRRWVCRRKLPAADDDISIVDIVRQPADIVRAQRLLFRLPRRAHRLVLVVVAKVFSTDILKISVVTDKREYRIYQKFIGDRNKILEEI